MLTLLAARPVTEDRYEDAGILTLGLALGGGLRRAWTRAVSGFWTGHRGQARARVA